MCMAPCVEQPRASSEEQEAQGQAPEDMPKVETRKAVMLQVSLCPWPRVSLPWTSINCDAHILDMQGIQAFAHAMAAIL